MEDEFEAIVAGLDLEEVPPLGSIWLYFEEGATSADSSPVAILEIRGYDGDSRLVIGVYVETSGPWGNQNNVQKSLARASVSSFKELVDLGRIRSADTS